jgi:hypothetical protein
MDPEAELGVHGRGDAWDGLGGVLGGGSMACAVMLWHEGALPGGEGAAAAAGDGMTTCALAGEAEACTLPWEGEPGGNEMPTPSPSCLPGGVGMEDAGTGRRSFLLGGGGGGETGESVSATLFWPIWLLLPPLLDPEGLPVVEEELEALLLGIPDMRSLDGTCPEGGGEGWGGSNNLSQAHPL